MIIHTDSIHRIAYSTDASVYREVPQGVVYPETVEHIVELVAESKRRNTFLIPRATGTFIADASKKVFVAASRASSRHQIMDGTV